MKASDFDSFKFGLGAKGDSDEELSNDDEEGAGGTSANENEPKRLDHDYFRGVLANSFVIGCQPNLSEESKTNESIEAQADLNQALDTYLTRCKKVGRLGPVRTELDRSSVHGDCLFGRDRNANSFNNASMLEMDGCEMLDLDIEAKSNFVSVRANTAVFKHCFFYEVTLLTDGLM